MIRKWFAGRFEDCTYWLIRASGAGVLAIFIGLLGWNAYYQALAWSLIEGPVIMLVVSVTGLFFMRRNILIAWIGLFPAVVMFPILVAWARYMPTTGWATRDWLGIGNNNSWFAIVAIVVVIAFANFAESYRKKHGK